MAAKKKARTKPVKKVVKAKPKVTKPAKKVAGKKPVGIVTHFFDQISVAVLKIKDTIKVGDTVSIEGPRTNFKQKINSMQVEHTPIQQAKKGDDVGIKVLKPVRVKDFVYKA